jgi:hypothetical protein
MILSFHCARDLAQGPWDGHGELRDIDPPEDMARREAKCASNEETRAQRERETNMSSNGQQKGGRWAPPRLGSSDEWEEEGGQHSLPFPPCAQLSPHLVVLLTDRWGPWPANVN